MLIRKFILFGQLLMLLLLVTHSVAGKTNGTIAEIQTQQKETLNSSASVFHENMLQPQLVHITAAPEHLVKQLTSGFGIGLLAAEAVCVSLPVLRANTIRQDVNRCESVSKLLFPYHIFW